ncbi:MAG: cation:proton antiporter [Solirubrobacteraceae bacterium]
MSTILEGEAQIDNVTALTVYKLAVAAAVSGHFSPGAGTVNFISVAAGAVAVGLAAGWVSVEVRKPIHHRTLAGPLGGLARVDRVVSHDVFNEFRDEPRLFEQVEGA